MAFPDLDDDYDDNEDELTPYNSISDREPLDDVTNSRPTSSDDMDANPMRNQVMSKIAQAYKPQADSLLKDEQNAQMRSDRIGELKAKSDFMGNLGQSFNQLAMGANKPQANPVFQNMSHQGESLATRATHDEDRRARVKQKIAELQTKSAIADISQNNRTKAQENKDRDYELRKKALEVAQNRFETNQKDKQDRLSSMNISRANQLLKDPSISQEMTKINAAEGVKELINKVKSGELVDGESVRNQITNLITKIEQGGGGSVEDRKHMGIDNFHTRLSNLESSLLNKPISSISPEFLKQLDDEASALGDKAALNYFRMANSALSGADLSGGNPDVDPGKVHQLAKQRVTSLLNQYGYDPETGARVKKQDQNKKAVRKQHNKLRNQTKLIYSDGSEEIKDGIL